MSRIFFRRRQQAAGLLHQHRRAAGNGLLDLRRGDVATGNLVALAIPGLHRGLGVVAILENPGLGLRHQVVEVADQVIDHAGVQRLYRIHALALEQIGQRRLEAEQLGQAHHATAAGEQAEGHLGQADLHRAVVPGHAVVAGQAQLVATAEGRTVDRGDHRHREFLEARICPLIG
jgi:hypothetical protein